MPMPQNIDMSLIREALMRRSGGQPTAPIANQVSQSVGTTPTGAPSTPVRTPQPMGNPPLAGQAGMGGAGIKPKTEAQFDDETRITAKALIQKLLKVI